MKNFQQHLLQRRIVHRAGNFHPVIQIPGHQIRGGDIQLHIPSPSEAVNPPMLQKAPHNAGHMNVLRLGRDSRPEAADAPQNQLHLDPRLGRLNQLVHDLPLCHGVGLHADIALRAFGDLPVNELQQSGLDTRRRYQQALVLPLQIAYQHVLEKGRAIQANSLVGGHEAQIRVLLIGALVVIAGADLGDIAEPVSPAQGDEADLAVALVLLHPVDHLTAGILHQPGPGDVVGLVKPGPELHEHRDLLSVFRRLAENVGHP